MEGRGRSPGGGERHLRLRKATGFDPKKRKKDAIKKTRSLGGVKSKRKGARGIKSKVQDRKKIHGGVKRECGPARREIVRVARWRGKGKNLVT